VNLTRLSLSNPVALVVAVLLALMFGAISLANLPVQLTPEVEEPQVTITTVWRAAAPEEVEAEIVEPQEKVLRGIPGLRQIIAKAQPGQGEVSLTFNIGTELERSLLEVMNRLNRVSRYPDDAEEPVLSSLGGNSRPIAWFIVKTLPGNKRDIASYQEFLEEVVQTRFERVEGVAMSEVRGGRDREVRITFDPYKAASLGVQLPVAAALAGGAKDTSGGFTDVGKRQYTLRFAGKYRADKLSDLVIDWRDGSPVLLRDVAKVEERLVDRQSFVIQNGIPAVAVNAHRETGVNVLAVMQGLRDAAQQLGDGPLKRNGLSIQQVYDETKYIDRSIDMVRNNLAVGVILAIGVLWWFLRRFRATLMVALAIPICIISSFILLLAWGRSINVISLAGMAFAVGMVLDAAIVVLENIVRLREHGEDSETASLHGTTQVWGALLASTATTVAIFLPVVFLKDEAGQLFADLALAIAASVIVSLIVAVTVLPAAARNWLSRANLSDPHAKWWDAITGFIMAATDTFARRVFWIVTLIVVPITIGYSLWPKADYLPDGNRNLVFAFILPPPGASINMLEKELGQVIAKRMQPYIDGNKDPHVSDYFFVAFPRGVFMGARTVDPLQTNKLVPLINGAIHGFPDTIAFARRTSLFGGFGEGRSIMMDLQGRNMESILEAGRFAFGAVMQAFHSRPRPYPSSLELAEPEIRLVPDERRIAEAGWNRQTMSNIVRALGDGLYVGDYFDGEQRLDVVLRAEPWSTPEDLGAIPLSTPKAGILPLSELVSVQRTAGPGEIRRTNRRRTVTLQVNLPENMSLEQGMEILKTKVEPQVRERMPPDGDIQYSGTADKLATALKNMLGTFLIALAILYLLMSALFRSFADSLLVMVSVPMAIVGGIVSLWLVNWVMILSGAGFQAMDLLTMIGFIILLGLVVNNAILLVHQTRAAEREEGMRRREAVQQAVRRRLRPILMGTLTSIFGMLPLLLAWGAGTELYRGLAAVIIGGMSISMVFTLVLLPSLLRMGENRVLNHVGLDDRNVQAMKGLEKAVSVSS